jgi:hypothetical protein
LLLLLLISMKWDYVSELRPSLGLLFIPQVILVTTATVEWTDSWKPKSSEKNLSQFHFVHHTSHVDEEMSLNKQVQVHK